MIGMPILTITERVMSDRRMNLILWHGPRIMLEGNSLQNQDTKICLKQLIWRLAGGGNIYES